MLNEYSSIFMKNNKRTRVENWLINNEDILRIAAIERKLGLSRGVIAKFLNPKTNRKLKNEEINNIYKLIEKINEVFYTEP